MALAGVFADEVAGVLALDCAGGRQDRDEAGLGALGGGFDRGDRADERHMRECGAQFVHHDGGRGVAGDQAQDRIVFSDEAIEQVDDMRLQRRLFPAAIGKARIIGDVDEAPVRHQDACFAQDREAADAAVEEEDGLMGRAGHSGSLGMEEV